MKCPICKKGTLKVFSDAVVRYELSECGRYAHTPTISTVFDAVRGIDCDHCGNEVTTETDATHPALEPIFKNFKIIVDTKLDSVQ